MTSDLQKAAFIIFTAEMSTLGETARDEAAEAEVQLAIIKATVY